MHNLRSVVTCGSEYFRAMLEHEMAESAGKSWTDLFLKITIFKKDRPRCPTSGSHFLTPITNGRRGALGRSGLITRIDQLLGGMIITRIDLLPNGMKESSTYVGRGRWCCIRDHACA
jgi:hypothetical protein